MKKNWITHIVELFLNSNLSIIFIIISMVLGMAAVALTPKEEDPQIVVPMADVMVQAPGVSAQEIDRLVTTPLEQLLWQIKGVEDVYAVSHDGEAVVTAKFFVGENETDALVRLFTKMNMNLDIVPSIVSSWIIKPISIHDVPIVNVALYSDRYSGFELRRIAEETLAQLTKIPNISKSTIVGGQKLQARIELNPYQLSAYRLTPLEIYQALNASDVSAILGKADQNNRQQNITIDAFIKNPTQLKNVVVGTYQHHPVYLHHVAKVIFGPQSPNNYQEISFNNSLSRYRQFNMPSYPAVTIGLAKKGGSNAVTVANQILTKLNQLKKTLIPNHIYTSVIRNYGQTAHDKVNDLLVSLGLAILTVIAVLFLSLGLRESLIVAVSVPISFALALFADYLLGYSINRVTLFALILSLGLVVDDPITNIENIQRHIRRGKEKIYQAILSAVNEVLPPVIMASLTIIVSFLPLFFITGMMGPYMSPMAATVPLTIIFSTICSLTIVPWMAYTLLKHHQPTEQKTLLEADSHHDTTPQWIQKSYRKIVSPLLESSKKRWGLFFGIIIALLLCGVLIVFQAVPLKLLPFDNKNELQLVINMPEGTTLEETYRVTNQFSQFLRKVPEIKHVESYVGRPSPMDFNGMVRHYYIRQADNLADIRINLIDKGKRISSHKLALKIRKNLEAIAQENHAKIAITEMPPGPPVLATIVGEVTGTPDTSYQQLIHSAKKIEALLATEKNVVDINDSTETPRQKLDFVMDKEKAALNGISAETIMNTLKLALGTATPMVLHRPNERAPLSIKMKLPQKYRSDPNTLEQLSIKNNQGQLVPLVALGQFKEKPQSQPIYQKDLHRLVYIYADTAGRAPTSAVISTIENIKNQKLLPHHIQVKWADEGSLKITARVFRDMGIGFAAALIAIYILLFIQTDSFLIPLVMMVAIPLTIIGIVPGFWILNLIANHPIGGFPTPVFFTATSMIGMIALGGIVIRNSLILINFIDHARKAGKSFKEAVLESGAVRFRPIILTALTASLGAWPITLDPIFSGLAWALIFGLLASTLFSLVVVPVTYYALYREK